MGAGGEVDEIASGGGLSAGQMQLQDAELSRFAENAQPGRGVKLVFSRVERERIGAIGAAERTTVSQLGEEPKRLMQHCGTNAASGPSIRRNHVRGVPITSA